MSKRQTGVAQPHAATVELQTTQVPSTVPLDDLTDQHCAHVFTNQCGMLQRRKDFGQRALGLHLALVQHHHMVGQAGQLLHRMGDIHHGGAGLRAQALKPGQGFLFARLVQRGQRFVEQQQPRLRGQSAGDCHPLAFAAGELGRTAPQQIADTEQHDRAVQHGPGIAGMGAPQPITQIRVHIQVLEQGRLLKNITQRTAPGGQEYPGGGILPDLVLHLHKRIACALQTGDTPQQAGLATTRGTEQHGDALGW